MHRNEVLALVYRRFAPAEAEFANGFAEHATMGAEALLTLGVDPSAVLRWAERHEPVPATDGAPLHVVRHALLDELATGDWRAVLRRHVAPLANRLDAHLFHGLIRTAHAARALGRHDTPDARAELATGLAAWHVWADADQQELTPSPSQDPRAEIVEMARRGAAAYIDKPSIFTLHAVTAPMAYLLIAEHLDAATDAVAASVFARTHRRHPVPPARTDRGALPGPAALAKLAEQWDAHPAKLVEAALRGYERSGDAVFLDAAATMMD